MDTDFLKDIVRSANDIYRAGYEELRQDLTTALARISLLEAAATKLIAEHDEAVSDSEGRYPSPDSGCYECTLHTVPYHLDTGLCGYHEAKRLLGVL